jgi:N-acetylmuramoyl-L-alanine amidase
MIVSTAPRLRARATRRRAATALPALVMLAAACPAPPAPPPSPVGPPGALPAVPLVEGPLALRVQYPSRGQLVEARDSNFIHGSVGNGRATLTINGHPVAVAPNGAFIGWLPLPPAEQPVYELVATLDSTTARDTLSILRPPPRIVLDSLHPVDSTSVSPRGGALRLRGDERVRVSVRALAGASVWVEWDTTAVRDSSAPTAMSATSVTSAGGAPPNSNIAARRGGRTTRSARPVPPPPPPPPVRQSLVRTGSEQWSTDVRAGALARGARIVVALGADTSRLALARPELVDPSSPRLVSLGTDTALVVSDTDRVIPGRPVPAGGYAWALLPGTVLETTGQQGAFTRVRLDERLEIWVDSIDARPLPAGTPLPRRAVGAFTVAPSPRWVDVQIPIGERPAYLVQEQGDAFVLTLYGTRVAPSLIRYLGSDTLVRHAVWEQDGSDRARLTIHLSQRPFGYLAFFDRGVFTLRVRRPPALNAAQPLAGLTIAVDAGHPPAGATGPTGLYEGDAVLPVADRAGALLAARGADVVRIRTTPEPYPLGQRSVDARRADAHAFVSVHLNALPDGVNPFTANGSSVLYYHPQAEPLARALERELVRQYGLRDLGVHFQNIAIGRTTWMPSVITEGLFIMMPEQEASMRSAEGRAQYARAIADGVEAYFRGLAGAR